MEPFRIREIKQGVFEDNDRRAEALRQMLKTEPSLSLNENVDNLVCPAVFDTGVVTNDSLRAGRRRQAAQVHALVRGGGRGAHQQERRAQRLFDCDIEAVELRAKIRNPDVTGIPIPVKTGEGIEA